MLASHHLSQQHITSTLLTFTHDVYFRCVICLLFFSYWTKKIHNCFFFHSKESRFQAFFVVFLLFLFFLFFFIKTQTVAILFLFLEWKMTKKKHGELLLKW